MRASYILMGDIIGSRDHDAIELRCEFLEMVELCNREFSDDIISPLTVTLGDEFQGVLGSASGVMRALLFLERIHLQRSQQFKLRYVALYGDIETPINRLRAHAMMGDGLTKARELLTEKHRGNRRFKIVLGDSSQDEFLNGLMFVMDGVSSRWKPSDGPLIDSMLDEKNNDRVGRRYGKDRTQIYKRRRNLMVDEYKMLNDLVLAMVEAERELM